MVQSRPHRKPSHSPRQARRQLNHLLRDPIIKPRNAAEVRTRLNELMAVLQHRTPTAKQPATVNQVSPRGDVSFDLARWFPEGGRLRYMLRPRSAILPVKFKLKDFGNHRKSLALQLAAAVSAAAKRLDRLDRQRQLFAFMRPFRDWVHLLALGLTNWAENGQVAFALPDINGVYVTTAPASDAAIWLARLFDITLGTADQSLVSLQHQRQVQADQLMARLAAKFAREEMPLVQAAQRRAAKSLQLNPTLVTELASDQPALTTHRDVIDRLAHGDYVVIDTEFVADRNQLDLTEISLLRIRQHQIDQTFDIFTQLPAGHHVMPFSVKITGITDDLLEKYGQPLPLVKTALQQLLQHELVVGFALSNDLRAIESGLASKLPLYKRLMLRCWRVKRSVSAKNTPRHCNITKRHSESTCPPTPRSVMPKPRWRCWNTSSGKATRSSLVISVFLNAHRNTLITRNRIKNRIHTTKINTTNTSSKKSTHEDDYWCSLISCSKTKVDFG